MPVPQPPQENTFAIYNKLHHHHKKNYHYMKRKLPHEYHRQNQTHNNNHHRGYRIIVPLATTTTTTPLLLYHLSRYRSYQIILLSVDISLWSNSSLLFMPFSISTTTILSLNHRPSYHHHHPPHRPQHTFPPTTTTPLPNLSAYAASELLSR